MTPHRPFDPSLLDAIEERVVEWRESPQPVDFGPPEYYGVVPARTSHPQHTGRKPVITRPKDDIPEKPVGQILTHRGRSIALVDLGREASEALREMRRDRLAAMVHVRERDGLR